MKEAATGLAAGLVLVFVLVQLDVIVPIAPFGTLRNVWLVPALPVLGLLAGLALHFWRRRNFKVG